MLSDSHPEPHEKVRTIVKYMWVVLAITAFFIA